MKEVSAIQIATATEQVASTVMRTPSNSISTQVRIPDSFGSEGKKPTPPSSGTKSTVVLDKYLHIGPFQTKVDQVNGMGMSVSDKAYRIVMASETLANLFCYFTEDMWTSNTPRMLAITNWRGEQLFIEQRTTMGSIEEV